VKTEAELNSNRLLNIKSEASLLTIDLDLKKAQMTENTEVESSKLSEINELKSKLLILKQEKQKLENDIYIKKEKLLFLNNDVCPYCDSKLEDENNKETLKKEIYNIEYDLNIINKNITDVITQGNKINIEYKNILQIKKELSINIDSLRSDINNLKKEYLYLSDKKDIVQSEIIEYITKLELENIKLEENISVREDKIHLYKDLLLVLDSPNVELLKLILFPWCLYIPLLNKLKSLSFIFIKGILGLSLDITQGFCSIFKIESISYSISSL
jgi:chromosome segregation ATPase